MSDDIRVGDRFLVEMVVESASKVSYVGCIPSGGEFSDMVSIHHSVLRASKRLQRAIKVGDRVRLSGFPATSIATVLAINDDYRVAWGKLGSSFSTYDLEDLTPVDEASS